ncbi:Uncharacterized membrane protein [Sparassis crispa]|uniref:Uncharacterized membrane protein n=1 Tax=Sparassis crispa TaxID=139825 RepID=A0A401GAY6_9APHY|nr:Uncharacterized membrane protein [Sparassis crispa]GBE79334.1 Uncharacterized membrane protein [Sparassis crispa]
MHARFHILPLLIPALAGALAAAAPPCHDSHDIAAPVISVPLELNSDRILYRRDERELTRRDGDHDHGGHHVEPLYELNETQVTLHHAPIPPSYWTIDMVDRVPGEHRYPGFMAVHIFFMSAAFFGALPLGIIFRSVKHAWHGFTVILFYAFCAIGLGSSMIYRKLTPDMYEGSKHGPQGYFWLFVALVISTLDALAMFVRLFNYVKALRNGEERFTFKGSWNDVILGRGSRISIGPEYTNLVEDPEELDMTELKGKDVDDESNDHDESEQWANDIHHHRRAESYPQSAASDGTLLNGRSPRHSSDILPDHVASRFPWGGKAKTPLLKKIGRGMFATTERVLVFAGLVQFITGVVTYTGGCRENYINGCLAHLIKGGIFWCYGLASFGRYLGAFSELGWAWNRAPSKQYPTAEFFECLIIFLYGASNTWMERFGARAGDPYTTKQVQHISIAVMFWFAGMVGMGIESKTIRRWLAAGSVAAIPSSVRTQEAVAEPPSYIASFNPFPALCIGITGIAMSAHFQVYVFQVQIHMLWGYLLAMFAVLRFLTYCFLWSSPPRSILPSRPPTEALASFFLVCGGLVFMFSTEEVTIAAMRQGHDDVMMFLNLSIAITCFACCWALALVGTKGYLKSHTHGAVSFHSSA